MAFSVWRKYLGSDNYASVYYKINTKSMAEKKIVELSKLEGNGSCYWQIRQTTEIIDEVFIKGGKIKRIKKQALP